MSAVVAVEEVAGSFVDVAVAVGSAGVGKTVVETDTDATGCSWRVRHRVTHSSRVPWRAMFVTKDSCCCVGDRVLAADEDSWAASCC